MDVEGFIEWLKNQELSDNTIDTYVTAIKIFFDEYAELSRDTMLGFKQSQMERWSPKTACARCVAMNQYCEFASHPEWKVKRIRLPKKTSVENVISDEEYYYLLWRLKKDGRMREYFVVKFLGKTGVRASEFTQLEKNCLKNGYMELWTKGKFRRIYIPQDLVEESCEYFAGTEGTLLFPSRYGKQLTTRGLDGILKRMAERYGIRREVMHPHSFRHFYAVEFLKRNSNIALLADYMGHESVDTTRVYLKLSEAEQKKEFNKAVSW